MKKTDEPLQKCIFTEDLTAQHLHFFEFSSIIMPRCQQEEKHYSKRGICVRKEEKSQQLQAAQEPSHKSQEKNRFGG